MSTLSTILAAVLGVVFVGAGLQKLTRQQMVVENFKRWGLADVILQATGWLEVLTGTFLLTGIAIPALAVTGSLLVIPIMLGALATHQRAHDGVALWAPPLVLLLLDLWLAYSLLP
jgi:putative oxidoreductase